MPVKAAIMRITSSMVIGCQSDAGEDRDVNFIVVDWSSVSRGIITMPDEELNRIANDLINRQMAMALSRWDGEGGAGPFGPQEGSGCVSALSTVPSLTNTELVQLRVRVIALENLVIALLADASDRQLVPGIISP